MNSVLSALFVGDFGYDVAWFLAVLTIVTAVLGLCGWLYAKLGGRGPFLLSLTHTIYEFWPSIFIIWLLRSFVIQPYRVPSGSLMPTVYPGDYIAVQQYVYGLRWPLTGKILKTTSKPKRGDLALFHSPVDLHKIYIKRVVGLPGDRIEYRDRKLYINGKLIERQWLAQEEDISTPWHDLAQRYQEQLGDAAHDIYLSDIDCGLVCDEVVPEGHYFMMGDNRDNSLDSRVWGTVPERLLIGKAFAVWMSWDSEHRRIRWDRIGFIH